MSPDDMARRVLFVSERAMTTTVNNIERIEATAYNGVGLIRVYMQQGTNVDLAVAQVTAVSQTLLRTMPPGIFPPLIVQTDASSVPILQLGLSSGTLTEQQLYDYGQNFIRTRLATIPGISVPLPYGGKVREVMVDLDPDALVRKRTVGHRHFERVKPPESDSSDRHREGGHARIPDSAQQQPGTDFGDERHADQDGERRAGVHARRRTGPGRLSGADQHGSHQWRPLVAADRLAAWRRIDIGGGAGRQGSAPENTGHASAVAEDHPTLRPVVVRAGSGARSGSRGEYRRVADRAHDSAVSRKLAQHADRLHFDPAFDSYVAHDPGAARARPST